jgi:Tfp pilus assembly protein PilN
MRAINLIPPEDRAAGASARAGRLSYLVLGLLLAILVGVTALVITNNQISERRTQLASLEQARAVAQARAESLQAFADFRTIQQERTATVSSLAQSRFDWERVLREFALVLPADVWLVELEGTVSPDVQVPEGVDVGPRESIEGPALELVGCTVSQQSVGRFAAALRDIDGVTRVAVIKSERPPISESSGGQSEGSEDDCRTRDFITRFEIVAAFDAVPVPASALPAPEEAPPAGEEDGPTPSDSQDSVEEGVEEGQDAANLAPGA